MERDTLIKKKNNFIYMHKCIIYINTYLDHHWATLMCHSMFFWVKTKEPGDIKALMGTSVEIPN